MARGRLTLVISPAGDVPAAWAAVGLRRRGLHVWLLHLDQLLREARLVFRLGAEVEVELGPGPGGAATVQGSEVAGVLNRASHLPVQHLTAHAPVDGEYAVQEQSAIVLGWLAALPGVVNPPTAVGLPGAWRDDSEWALLAQQAGLPAPPYRMSTDPGELGSPGSAGGASPRGSRRVVVLDDRVFGAHLPGPLREGCVRLAELASTPLLGVELLAGRTGTRFAGATPLPDLRLGGGELLDALADRFRAAGPA